MRCFVDLYIESLAWRDAEAAVLQDSTEDKAGQMDRFLAGVERRAFRIAQIALRHEQDALDAVQDSMLQLVRSYAARPADEWRPLFYRILENRVRDFQRRRSVRDKVMSWMPWQSSDDDDAQADLIAQAPDKGPDPSGQAESGQMLQALEAALQDLPPRQRQCFLLRNLEGLDVAETAAAMHCSEGSVKTHHFRALQALRARLGEHWQ
jgi:RNA polymerase sigma-70 factor (ECF subfamily)